MEAGTAVRPVHEVLLVAMLLTIGLTTLWELAPGPLSVNESADPVRLVVAALFTLPLAIVAAAGSCWLVRRRHQMRLRSGGGDHIAPVSVPLHAGLIAAVFTVLVLATAPTRQAVYDVVAPASRPNLAVIHDDGHSHHPMADHAQLTGQRLTLDLTGWNALAVAGVVLLLAMLGMHLVRFLPSSASKSGMRVRVLPRSRARWAAAGGTLTLLATGSLMVLPATHALAVPPPFSVPLRIPPVLTGQTVNLTMSQTDVQLMPSGPPTRMWTYNGMFPGPTVRRPSGQTTEVTVQNQLPQAAGSMTVHNHGNHSRSSEDGQPTTALIPSGGSRTYTYEHLENGTPERASTQWYHDHRMDVTGRNVWNGLAGMYILDDAVEGALPLPKDEFDVPLMIVDRTFDSNNQIPYSFNELGTQGNTILVNGAPQPHYDVGDRKYRFRVLNASNRRSYTLALSNGQSMTQIGTESGLLPAPVTRDQIRIFPAERVEIVIDFAGRLGQQFALQNLEGDGTGTSQIMQFRVSRDLTDTSIVPSTLRPAPTFPAPVRTRSFSLNFNPFTRTWLINGRAFDPNRVEATPVLGTTERWTFTNLTIIPHVVHIHDVDWRLVSRNGGAPAPWESGLKESWVVPPFEQISIVTTFTDNVGRYVFHCHMLEHEDRAMMAQFEVRPPA